MKAVLRTILISILAISLVAGTIMLDQKLRAAFEEPIKPDVSVLEKGSDMKFKRDGQKYSFRSGADKRTVVMIGEHIVLRLAPSAEVSFDVSDLNKMPKGFSLNINKGRIWLNSINSYVFTEINAGKLNAQAEPGVFDIEYSGGKLSATAHRHSIQLAFLGNKLVLPEGRKIEISAAKIEKSPDTISKLRFSKLVKEFPYFEKDKPDDWESLNKTDDENFVLQLEKASKDQVRDSGSRLGFDENSLLSSVNDSLKKTVIALTFDTDKRERREATRVFAYFDSAVYASLIGKADLSRRWLESFSQEAVPYRGQDFFENRLADSFDDFSYVDPADGLFGAKTKLRGLLPLDPLAKLHVAFLDVLDTAAQGADSENQQRVSVALRKFGSLVANFTPPAGNTDAGKDLLAQFVNLNDFMNRNPYLLKDEFLKILAMYEKGVLKNTVNKEEADDQRQFFISEKLKAMKIVKLLIEKGDVQFQDGRRSVIALADSIEELKPDFSDSAVASYFDQQLAEMGSFISFLRSTRAEHLRGSFEEGFSQFQEDMLQTKKITELLEGAAGGVQITPFRREELASIVAADLSGIKVSGIKIILPEDEEDPRVKIVSAKFEAKNFSAVYDTINKVFSDIVFEKEKISNAIRLENFSQFFLIKMGKLELPKGANLESLAETQPQQSVLEKLGAETLRRELQKLNISVDDKYLDLADFENEDIIRVKLALLGEGVDAKAFSFEVTQKASLVTDLKVQTVKGEIQVKEPFALGELAMRVEKIYQRAVLDQQREEELAKFLDTGTTTDIGTSVPLMEDLAPLTEALSGE